MEGLAQPWLLSRWFVVHVAQQSRRHHHAATAAICWRTHRQPTSLPPWYESSCDRSRWETSPRSFGRGCRWSFAGGVCVCEDVWFHVDCLVTHTRLRRDNTRAQQQQKIHYSSNSCCRHTRSRTDSCSDNLDAAVLFSSWAMMETATTVVVHVGLGDGFEGVPLWGL